MATIRNILGATAVTAALAAPAAAEFEGSIFLGGGQAIDDPAIGEYDDTTYGLTRLDGMFGALSLRNMDDRWSAGVEGWGAYVQTKDLAPIDAKGLFSWIDADGTRRFGGGKISPVVGAGLHLDDITGGKGEASARAGIGYFPDKSWDGDHVALTVGAIFPVGQEAIFRAQIQPRVYMDFDRGEHDATVPFVGLDARATIDGVRFEGKVRVTQDRTSRFLHNDVYVLDRASHEDVARITACGVRSGWCGLLEYRRGSDTQAIGLAGPWDIPQPVSPEPKKLSTALAMLGYRF